MIKIITDKQKIIKYLEYKGISKNKFYIKTGLSIGFLDSGSSLGVDKLRKIIDNYPDLSIEWIVIGKEPMIKNEERTNTSQNITGNSNIQSGNGTSFIGDCKEKVEDLQRQLAEKKIEIEWLKNLMENIVKKPKE